MARKNRDSSQAIIGGAELYSEIELGDYYDEKYTKHIVSANTSSYVEGETFQNN